MLAKLVVYLKNFDWILFSSILLLVCFGLAEIYSVALGQGDESFLNFKKQILFAMAGIVLLFAVSFIDYHYVRSYSNYIYLVGVFLLMAVLVFGQTIRGTRGWFYIMGAGIQPVELIKAILILFLARYFSGASLRTNQLKHLAVAGTGFLIFFILVLAQPDFGSGMLLFATWLVMVIAAGFDKKFFIAIALIISVLFVGAWAFYLKPYQKQRIMTFINPSFDPLNQGYNVAQAIIAVGAGGLSGRGIGFGSQSQLKFLPESQNDFIFAVVAEELGFLGICLVLSFFAIFFYRCLYNIKKNVKDDFGIFFILGASSLIFMQMFINIGMNIGILPVVGISLPFVSYGGSSMVSSLVMVGFIQSIIIRSKINY